MPASFIFNPSLLTQTAPFRGQAGACQASKPQSADADSPFRGTPLPLCSSGRLRYSISFGNLIDAPTRRVVAPSLMRIPSTNNIAYVGFDCAKPLNPYRLQRNGHCEENPLVELPAAVADAAGVRIFRLWCQYASSRQYHLP